MRAEHHERYYLYLIITVTVGVLLCLIIITGRIVIQKQRDEGEDRGKDEPKFHKSSSGETTITKGFSGDNISEVEGGDIDLTTPIAISNLPPKSEVSDNPIVFHDDVQSEWQPNNGNLLINVLFWRICWDDQMKYFLRKFKNKSSSHPNFLSLHIMFSHHHRRLLTRVCHYFQKSSFNTYTPMAPYVSIVPTSSAAATGLLIRPPQPLTIGGPVPPSSILIGAGGLNNNPSLLAQSPSNLGNFFLSLMLNKDESAGLF